MFFSRKRKYPQHFRHKQVFVKLLSEKEYIKSWITPDGIFGETKCPIIHVTAAELFAGWKQITQNEYLKHLEIMRLPRVSTSAEKQIKWVFNVGDVDYFTFADIMDFPAGRFHECEIFKLEAQARLTRDEILKGYQDIIAAIDNPKEFKVSNAIAIARDQIARMNLTLNTGIYESLASALFFDEQEDLTTYNPDYNRRKIANWREHGGESFFLLKPVRDLLPFPGLSDADFLTFLRNQENIRRAIDLGLAATFSEDSTKSN